MWVMSSGSFPVGIPTCTRCKAWRGQSSSVVESAPAVKACERRSSVVRGTAMRPQAAEHLPCTRHKNRHDRWAWHLQVQAPAMGLKACYRWGAGER